MMSVLLHVCYCVLITKFVSADLTGNYTIPEPKIVAFQGGGLRVTLKHEPGITKFRFHGNINEDSSQLYPDEINISATRPINGKWVLEDRTISLYIRDVIYYWLFVEKDGLGYIKQSLRFKVKGLVPYYSEDEDSAEPATPKIPSSTTSRTTTVPVTAPLPTTTSCSCNTDEKNALNTLQVLLDALNKKIDLLYTISSLQNNFDSLAKKLEGLSSGTLLQNEVKNISKNVELIMSTLEHLPEARQLTLTGVQPTDSTNPAEVVRFILWERLDLRVPIVSATRNKDTSIVFELKTLQDKFDVLNAAQTKLKNSRISIL